jgi:DNA end-binding protein Ku
MSSATLSLGLVAIPVGLHATRRREGRISYHLVHAKDGSRVKRQYVCEEEGVPVEDDELARAYEGDEGEVVMSKEEAQAALPKATGRIDLIEFVPAETIDPVYFENAYYLSPGKGGDRAYHLLAETLRDVGSVGVGTQIARGKSYLVAVRASQLGLVMHTLHHDEEVHREKDVAHGEGGRLNASEREMARSLVAQLGRAAFDPSKFEDEADKALEKLIKEHAKAEAAEEGDGQARKKTAKRKGDGDVVDLLASLRASLEGGARAKSNGKAASGKSANGKAKTAKATSHSPRARAPRGRATRARPYAGRNARSSRTHPRTRARAR